MYPKTHRFRRNKKFDRAKCGGNKGDFARLASKAVLKSQGII